MARTILSPHIRETRARTPWVVSLAGHLLILLAFIFGVPFLPSGRVIVLGSGQGGGQSGDYVQVGLTAELGGGEGMYKPAITPRPEAVAPPPEPDPPPAVEEEEPPREDAFVEPEPAPRSRPAKEPAPARGEPRREAARRASSKPQETPPASPGPIPREPEPGSGGPAAGSTGAGGGFMGGQGVLIGTGSGEGELDSWYVRQVEQRIGQNWLRSSLGAVDRPVRTVISFEIRSSGVIDNIQIEQRSGVASVDLAAERAVRASTPLPPLPPELRHRRVRILAHFDYPPR